MPDDSPAERLRQLADEILAAAEGGSFAVVNSEIWSADLIALAADVEKATSPEVPPAQLCGKTARFTRGDQCDRPASHKGDCSWEAQRQRRHARQYEEAANQVSGLRSQATDLRRRLARANVTIEEQRLKEEALKSRRTRRKPDRG